MSRLLRLAKVISIVHNNRWVQKEIKDWSEYFNIPAALISSWGDKQEKYISKLYEHNVFEDPIDVFCIILMPNMWKKQVPKYKEFYNDLIEGKDVIVNIESYLYDKYDSEIRKLMDSNKTIIINDAEVTFKEVSKKTNMALKKICLLYVLGSVIPSVNNDRVRYVSKLCKGVKFLSEKSYSKLQMRKVITYKGKEYTLNELATYVKNNSDLPQNLDNMKNMINSKFKRSHSQQDFDNYIDNIMKYSSNKLSDVIQFNINGKLKSLAETSELIGYDQSSLIGKIKEYKKRIRERHMDWDEKQIYDEAIKQISEFCTKIVNEQYTDSGNRYVFNIKGVKCSLVDISKMLNINKGTMQDRWERLRAKLGDQKAFEELKRLVEEELDNPGNSGFFNVREFTMPKTITYNGKTQTIDEWMKEPQYLLYDPSSTKLKRHVYITRGSTEEKVNEALKILDNIYNNRLALSIVPISINGMYQYKAHSYWYEYCDMTRDQLRLMPGNNIQEKIQYVVDKLNEFINIDSKAGLLREWLKNLNIYVSEVIKKPIEEIKNILIERIHAK